MSIHVTIPVAYQVFHARSRKVKTKLPFPVNVCPVAFRPVIGSLNPVTVAITLPLVTEPDHGTYVTVAVGGVVSTTVNVELAGQLIVPSLTVIVTPVFACVNVVFNVVVDCPAVKLTHVVYVGVHHGHV